MIIHSLLRKRDSAEVHVSSAPGLIARASRRFRAHDQRLMNIARASLFFLIPGWSYAKYEPTPTNVYLLKQTTLPDGKIFFFDAHDGGVLHYYMP